MSVTVERLVGEVEFRTTKAKQQLKSLDKDIEVATRPRTVRIDVDIDQDAMRAKVTAATAVAGAGQKIEVEVDVDSQPAQVAKGIFSSLATSLTKLTSSAGKTDMGFSKLTRSTISLNSVFRTLGHVMKLVKFSAFIIAVPLLSSVLQALSSSILAVVGSLSSMSGILATIPGLLFGAAGAAGTLITAFKGIGGALGAYSAAQKKAVGGGGGGGGANLIDQQKELAEAVVRAERALVNANRSVERANRNLADSNRGLTDAQERQQDSVEGLIEARDRAENQLEDLVNATAGYALQEERAINKIEDARKELTFLESDPAATERELEEASLSLAEAELNLIGIKQRRGRSEEDLAESQKKGIEGSDAVVSAHEEIEDSALNLVDANQGVVDATIAVADAQYYAAEAFKALGDAQAKSSAGPQSSGGGGGGGGVDEFADAMAGLSPAAKAFVTEAIKIKEAFVDIQTAVAEATLPGFTVILEGVSANLPQIGKGLVDLGASLSLSAAGFGEFLKSAEGMRDVGIVMDSTTVVGGNLGQAMFNLAQWFIQISAAVAPLTEWISGLILNFSEYLLAVTETNRANGDLEGFFTRVKDRASLFGNIVRDLTMGIVNFFSAGTGTGDGLLVTLAGMSEQFRSWTESEEGRTRMIKWFEDMKPLASEVWGLIGDLTASFTDIGDGASIEGATNFVKTLREEVIPGLEGFFTTIGESELGPAVLQFFSSVGGFISTMLANGGGMENFVKGLSKFFDVLTKIMSNKAVASIVAGIATAFIAFKVAMIALGPIIGVVSKLMLVVSKLSLVLGIGVGPLLLIGIAIAALVLAFIWAYKNVEPFRKVVDRLVESFKNGLLIIASKVLEAWNRLSAAFQDGGFMGALKELGSIAGEAAMAIWDALWGVIQKLPGWALALGGWIIGTLIPKLFEWGMELAGSFLSWVWDVAKKIPGLLWNVLKAIGSWVIDSALPKIVEWAGKFLTAFLGWIITAATEGPKKLWEFISTVATWIVTTGIPEVAREAAGFIGAIIGWVSGIDWSSLPGKLWEIITTMSSWILTATTSIIEFGVSIATFILDGIKDLGTTAYDWIKDDLPDKILAAVNMLGNGVKTIGKKIGQFLLDGITDTLGALIGLIPGLADGAIFNSIGAGSGRNTQTRGGGGGGGGGRGANQPLGASANGTLFNGPTIALVGEAGPEVLIPLTRPDRALELFNQSGLANTLMRANVPASSGGGGGGGASGSAGSSAGGSGGSGISVGTLNINGSNMSPDEAMRAAWSTARTSGAS